MREARDPGKLRVTTNIFVLYYILFSLTKHLTISELKVNQLANFMSLRNVERRILRR